MTLFRSFPDPKNSNNYFIHDWSQPAEWFLTADQGMYLSKKHLFEGNLVVQHTLESKPGALNAIAGLLELHESRLIRVNDAVETVLLGSYTFMDHVHAEPNVSVYFVWHKNSTIQVLSVAFANSKTLDLYFQRIKFTSVQNQLVFILEDFKRYLPITTHLLLSETGFKTYPTSVGYVETDWDLT